MPLIGIIALAIVIGLCNGTDFRPLATVLHPRLRIQKSSAVDNGSSSVSSNYNLSSVSSSPAIVSHSPTEQSTPRNSTTPIGTIATGSLPQPTSNRSCGEPALNVLGASLDWWYTLTVYNEVATFSIQRNNNESSTGWTLLPATTSFDLTSAIGESAAVAAETTVITQTAYKTPNATTGNGQIPNVIVTPPPAAISVPGNSNAFSEGTPFVFFSRYEIISKTPTFRYGSPGCAVSTRTSSMATPFAFPYTGLVVNGSEEIGLGVTGDVNPAFLGVVGESAAVAGSWAAAPTVVIVQQDIFVAVNVRAASLERSQKSLMTPSATLPSILFPFEPQITTDTPPTGRTKGHTETTQMFLLVPTPSPAKSADHQHASTTHDIPTTAGPPNDGEVTIVPFVAHLESTEITLKIPVGPTEQSITTTFMGSEITATRFQQGSKPTGNTDGGGGVRPTIASVADEKPKNALQVLWQAGQSLQHETATQPETRHDVGAHSGAGPGDEEDVPAIVVGETIFTANAKTEFDLGSSRMLTPGGTAIIAETSLHLFPDASSIVINGHTAAVSMAHLTPVKMLPVIVLAGTSFTANENTQFRLEGSKTLTPGGTVIIAGTSLRLLSDGSSVVVNGRTTPVSVATITPVPPLTISSHVYHANSGSSYVISGETLTHGGVITIQGTPISLAPGLSSVVINGITKHIDAPHKPSGPITSPPALTIGGEKFTPVNDGATYLINGETLTTGEEEKVTICGKTYLVSLAPGATILVVKTLGPNGKVTATVYETLYPGGKGWSIFTTTTVGVHASTKHSASKPATTYGPVPNLQNSARTSVVQLSIIAGAIGIIALAVWL